MKRRTVWSLVPLLAALLLAGLPALAQDGLGQTYDWAAKGLSIAYPDGWAAQELTENIVALLADPTDVAALSSSDVAPKGPVVALLVTDNLSDIGVSEGETLTETLQNWAENALNADFSPIETTTLIGLEATSTSGDTQVGEERLPSQVYLTQLPDGQYLMVLAIRPATAEAFPEMLDAMLASLVVAGVNDSPVQETPVPQQDGGEGLGETFNWEAKDLQVDYPTGWAAQVLTTLSPDLLALAANAEDINALLGGADVPTEPVVVLILSPDVNSIFGTDTFAEDATLHEKLERLADLNLSGAPEIVETTLAGLDALRADGPGSGDLYYALLVAETADGQDLLALAAIPGADAAAFAPTLDAILASLRFAEAPPPQDGGEEPAADGLGETFRWPGTGLTVQYPSGWRVASLDIGAIALLSNPADDPQEAPTAPAVLLLPLANLPGLDLEPGAQPDAVLAALAEEIGSGATSGVERLVVAGYYAARTQFVSDGQAFDVVVVVTDDAPLAIIGVAPPEQAAELTAAFEPILAAVSTGAAAQSTPAPVEPLVLDLPQGPDNPLDYAIAGGVVFVEPAGGLPHHAFYAPDGLHYAYPQAPDVLCRTAVNDSSESCITLPREDIGGVVRYDEPFLPASWAPDSTRMAVVGVPYRLFRDSDLLVIDFATGNVVNLANDGYADNLIGNDELNTLVTLDIQPAWSPDGRFIATERAGYGPDGLEPAHIVIIDAESGDVRELARPPFFSGGDNPPDAGSTMALAWSPDGTRIAASFRPYRPDQLNVFAHGVYVIDVATGDMDLVVSYADVHNAIVDSLGLPPEDYPMDDRLLPYYLAHLQWSPDATRLLFWSENPQYAANSASRQPLWVDLESGDLHTIPLPRHPDDPAPEMQLVQPYQTAWSPDGRTLLLVTRQLDTLPGETINALAGEESGSSMHGLRLLDPATGEMRLLGHVPSEVSWPGNATWARDGHVYAAGYALQLLPE